MKMLRIIPEWSEETAWLIEAVHREVVDGEVKTNNELAVLIERLEELNTDVEYILKQQWYSNGTFILADLPEDYGDDPEEYEELKNARLVKLPISMNRYEVQEGFDNQARFAIE